MGKLGSVLHFLELAPLVNFVLWCLNLLVEVLRLSARDPNFSLTAAANALVHVFKKEFLQ